ncbi:superoxide dismutase [Thermocrinis jamiesonii]|jgi:Superoxide dismutase|uniref:superoxide dismutase n=1 Tax=Thermocrinis jamiesonii TaxID=1302351 RepID=UPI000497FB1A|nr:superoxide dismutase [Thermocrinis jamiesonii]
MAVHKLQPKDHLKPSNLKGISNDQIEPHFEAHYKGYVTKYNEIQEKLADLNFSDRSKANQNYSEFRELKVEETFNYMGVVLHELYFGHLGAKGQPSEAFKKKVEEDFGSWDACVQELKATGIAFRGWAVLGLDIFSGRLVINGLDAHNVYNYTGLIPLIVLDTYEHAYYVDYKNKRPPYIDAFLENINWDVVNERFEKAMKAYEALKDFIK